MPWFKAASATTQFACYSSCMASFWYVCPSGHYEVRGEAFFQDGEPSSTIECRAVLRDGTGCRETGTVTSPPEVLSFDVFRNKVRENIHGAYRHEVSDQIIEDIVNERGPLIAQLSFQQDSSRATRYWQVGIPLTPEGAIRAADLIMATVYEVPETPTS